MNRPVRVIGTNRRSLTGQVSFLRGSTCNFESSLERDFLMILDFDPLVATVCEQPLTLKYQDDDRKRRQYTPDMLVTYSDEAAPILYEVKYREDLRENWHIMKPKFQAAIRYCKQQGWGFRIVTEREIRGTGLLNNARFLRAYRDLAEDSATATHLARTLAVLGETTPEILLTAAYANEEKRMCALCCLWQMIAIGRVHADLIRPLNMSSPIWITNGEGFLWLQSPLFYR
ncbi:MULTISPECIES: TnsA endonuclease N-terminal domain-containing protein [Psychrobacter]|nr:TnsA endonuclease N-terminal domain-containing protein [Psychrobacter sp. FME6]